MSARAVLDRYVRLLEAGDVEGLAGLHHEDAVLVRFDRVVAGRDGVRSFLAGQVAQRLRVTELLEVAETEDTVLFHAAFDLGGEVVRGHGTLLLRGERILRHTQALFPAASGAARGRAQVTVDLEPYTPWVARAVPDPRSAGREALGPVVLEIVGAEGPVLADRAYRLYVKAGGGKALTSIARAPLSGAAHRLKAAGAIELTTEHGQELLRPAGAPPVRVRELGPRALDEVPHGELVELVRRLRDAGATDLPRAVLDAYGLVRMTAKAEQLLDAAVQDA